jgi:hypothetical protein
MSTKRWIEANSGASELERDVLASGIDAEPPAGAEHAVWQHLVAAMGPLPPPGGGVGPAAPSGAAAAGAKALGGASTIVTLGKGFVVGIGVSLAAAGIGRLENARSHATSASDGMSRVRADTPHAKPASSPNPQPELPRTRAVAGTQGGLERRTEPSDVLGTPEPSGALVASSAIPTALANSAAAPSDPESSALTSSSSHPFAASRSSSAGVPGSAPPALEAHAASASSVAAFPLGDAGASSPRSELEEEATLLRRARAELHAGRLAEAFATLEASREKFSFPELRQEREALLIELLYRSGQRTSAVEKAKAFLSKYPKSPHAAQVRSIANAETP